jgi:hypothetical protein
MRLDLNDVTTVFISLGDNALAHGEAALECPLDHGALDLMRRFRCVSRAREGLIIMARGSTRGSDKSCAFLHWSSLVSSTKMPKGLTSDILWKLAIGDPVNHIHEIWSIGKMLHGITHSTSKFIPNEVKYAKSFVFWSHTVD